ncbi:hypothetical protein COY23_00780 [bacterium (Candidatus Torokbacteria) CG_4_10_14_0_2_um_filter_35_8]|nr:MAG: hypothetical protein COY23_00780 [bacterium (Candidatus Torokbacteria) CG_4_10_14_0_2_um_filter_35_8]
MDYFFFKANNKGQSLVETIIAMSVITVGLLACVSLITFTISIQGHSRQEVIAVSLARESLEVIRNTRDSNWLENDETGSTLWDQGIEGSPEDRVITVFDPNTNEWVLEPVSDINDSRCQIYFSEEDSLYLNNFPSGTPTSLRRLVTIKTISDVQKQVSVKVQWQEKDNTREITLDNDLYNWWKP